MGTQRAALVAVLVVIVPSALVARSTTTGSSSQPAWQVVVLGLLFALLLLGLVSLGTTLAGVDPDARAIAARLAPGDDQRRLLERWLNRTRWARSVGGWTGLAWWATGTSMHGDVLLFGIGGLALGSIAAQLHHVRPISGPPTASLERRTVAEYLNRTLRRRLIVAASAGAALAIAGATMRDSRSSLGWGLAAIGFTSAAALIQRRVAGRPRPALPTGIRQADDLARELAIDRGLALPAVYGTSVLIAHGASALRPSIGGLASVISLVAWLYGLYSWWHNRRLGLDYLLDRPATSAAG